MRPILQAICILIFSINQGICQDIPVPHTESSINMSSPGDRVTSSLKQIEDLELTALADEEYRLGPGDVLSVNVQGRSALRYQVKTDTDPQSDPSQVTVSSNGSIYIPLAGAIQASGKTVSELEATTKEALAKYLKNFNVSISLVKVRSLYIWVGGEVENTGPQMLPAISSVSLAVLRAEIRPGGSVRRIELIRDGSKRYVDLYRMTVLGGSEGDINLQPGDSIHVPGMTSYVEVSGEVARSGRYEMVTLSGETQNFKIKDLLQLSLGVLPTAALDKAYLERIGDDGKRMAIGADLRDGSESYNMELKSGDTLVVPSISAFQPMIRLIGEFKGDGVYQRVQGSSATDIQNKSGIYYLRKGQTARDIITATGGVTPQADLKKARIERRANGKTLTIPLDLERLMIHGDDTADVELLNGDSIVLPAVADRIHVFGEVKNPGSYNYSPNRKLIDYMGDAGGPTQRAKLTDVGVVRGSADVPRITKLNIKRTIEGRALDGNPVLEPGDIVYVPPKFVSDWRDAVQLVFTSLSLASLLGAK